MLIAKVVTLLPSIALDDWMWRLPCYSVEVGNYVRAENLTLISRFKKQPNPTHTRFITRWCSAIHQFHHGREPVASQGNTLLKQNAQNTTGRLPCRLKALQAIAHSTLAQAPRP